MSHIANTLAAGVGVESYTILIAARGHCRAWDWVLGSQVHSPTNGDAPAHNDLSENRSTF